MKILYVITAAGWGGAPLHVVQLMEYMVRQGHEVGLVAAPEPRLMEGAKALGAKIFPNPHFVRRLCGGYSEPFVSLNPIWYRHTPPRRGSLLVFPARF